MGHTSTGRRDQILIILTANNMTYTLDCHRPTYPCPLGKVWLTSSQSVADPPLVLENAGFSLEFSAFQGWPFHVRLTRDPPESWFSRLISGQFTAGFRTRSLNQDRSPRSNTSGGSHDSVRLVFLLNGKMHNAGTWTAVRSAFLEYHPPCTTITTEASAASRVPWTMTKPKIFTKFDGESPLRIPRPEELTRTQVEAETFPRQISRDREGKHDHGLTQGQISPRRLRRLHSISVRFREGFHPGIRTHGQKVMGKSRG